jgi:hypothetical protein
MSPKIKIVLGSLAGAVAIHLALLACSSTSAMAVASTLDVAQEPCVHTMMDPNGTFHYASHAYAGLTAAQLSQVRALGHIAGDGVSPLGYPYGVPRDQGNKFDGLFVMDGSVAVVCGIEPPAANGTPSVLTSWYDNVTFTLVK